MTMINWIAVKDIDITKLNKTGVEYLVSVKTISKNKLVTYVTSSYVSLNENNEIYFYAIADHEMVEFVCPMSDIKAPK